MSLFPPRVLMYRLGSGGRTAGQAGLKRGKPIFERPKVLSLLQILRRLLLQLIQQHGSEQLILDTTIFRPSLSYATISG